MHRIMRPRLRQVRAILRDVSAAMLGALIPKQKPLSVDERAVRALAAPRSDNGHAALLPYQNEHVKRLIFGIKHREDRTCLRLAASLILRFLRDRHDIPKTAHCLCTVPPTAARRRAGQNDHLRDLLTEMQRYDRRLRVNHAALRWRRDVRKQNTLPLVDRQENVRGALRADASILRDAVHVVIDDVTTTGATLTAASQALTEAGAVTVITVAIAH